MGAIHDFFGVIDKELAATPGTKVDVMKHFGTEETELRAFIAALVAVHNTHKSLEDGDKDDPIPWPDVSF